MSDRSVSVDPLFLARLAGGLYLVILLTGLWSEIAVRAPIAAAVDPAETVAALRASAPMLRLSLVADTVMLIADVGLAVVLYHLLRPVGPLLALTATAFRLLQAAIIGGALMFELAALLLAERGGGGGDALAPVFFALHGLGYDLGLVFFAVTCLAVGILVFVSGFLARVLGLAMMAAGAVYLAGSTLRFLAPDLADAFAPAYLVPVVAEGALCLILLIRGVDRETWRAAASAHRPLAY